MRRAAAPQRGSELVAVAREHLIRDDARVLCDGVVAARVPAEAALVGERDGDVADVDVVGRRGRTG